jgi:hypothetical protein
MSGEGRDVDIPTEEQVAEAMYLLAEWVRNNFDVTEVDRDRNEPGVKARLQIADDGWQVFREERYEEDDGLWASIWLPYDADEILCEELAEQLLGEIEEDM